MLLLGFQPNINDINWFTDNINVYRIPRYQSKAYYKMNDNQREQTPNNRVICNS